MNEPSHQTTWFPEVNHRLVDLNASVTTGLPRDVNFDSVLEHEILFLEHAATRLKRLQNTRRPLMRLPPEILASIADILTNDWPAFTDPYEDSEEYDTEESDDVRPATARTSDKRLSLGWILLSHVCHALRDMLLSRQVFWARVVSRNTRAWEDILERCGETPLHLSMEPRVIGVKRAQSILDFIFEHISRAHTVDVITFSGRASMALFDPVQLLQKTMPHLIDIRIRPPHDRRRLQLLAADFPKLPNLNAPRLATVRFDHFIVPLPFDNLVHLEITFSHRCDAMSANYITDLLSHSDLLETLTLHNCLPVFPSANVVSGPELPRLQSVNLRDEARRVLAAWEYIRAFRPSACFILRFGKDLVPGHASEQTSAIPVSLQGNVDGQITGLSIYAIDGENEWGRDAYWDGRLDRMTNYVLSFFAPQDGAPLRDYRFNQGDNSFKFGFKRRLTTIFDDCVRALPSEVLSSLTSVVDLGVVTTLSLDATALHNPSTECITLLRPLVNLHTLYLRVGAKSIILALTPSSVAGDPNPLLPRLRTLCISGLQFSGSYRNDGVPLDAISTYSQMLQERAQCGAALQHLCIDKLYMDKDTAENVFIPRMKSFVSSVHCTAITPTGRMFGIGHASFPPMNPIVSSESESESE